MAIPRDDVFQNIAGAENVKYHP
jgi:hypothetical protein